MPFNTVSRSTFLTREYRAFSPKKHGGIIMSKSRYLRFVLLAILSLSIGIVLHPDYKA